MKNQVICLGVSGFYHYMKGCNHMAIKITCDTKDEADFIGEAINVFQSEAGPLPYLNPMNTTISVDEDKFTDWYVDDDGETFWDFYGLDDPDEEEENDEDE